MNRTITLAVVFALLPMLPALADDTELIGPRELAAARKQLADARIRAQKYIVCWQCKGSGKYARTIIFGDRNEYKTHRTVKCESCVDGVVWNKYAASAVAEYYAVLSQFQPKRRSGLEGQSTLANWLLARVKTPRAAAALTREFTGGDEEIPTGAARLYIVDMVEVHRAPDESFNLLLSRPHSPQPDDPSTLFVHHGAIGNKIGRFLRRRYVPSPFLVVAYSEPGGNYKDWAVDWKAQLEQVRASELNLALPLDRMRCQLIDQSLAVVKDPKSTMTIAAAKPLPPAFKSLNGQSARPIPTVPTGQGPTARR